MKQHAAASAYHNVFFYFRGPSRAGPVSRQVEDNTTKALVNLLDHAGSDLASSFLAFVGVDAPRDAQWEFWIQGGPVASTAPRRRLMVITSEPVQLPSDWARSAAAVGRIDAAFHVPGDLLCVVEAKVSAPLDIGQLVKHASTWGVKGLPDGDQVPDAWIFTTWREIHDWAAAEAQARVSGRTRWLLSQFVEYLEIVGLAPYPGLRPEDFAYLQWKHSQATAEIAASEAGDPSQAIIVKRRIQTIWEIVRSELKPDEAVALGEIHIGTVKQSDDRVWAVTNWGRAGANLTLEAHSKGLELVLVGWNMRQAPLVRAWLRSAQFVNALERLGSFELVIWKRRAMIDHKGAPFWQHAKNTSLRVVPLTPDAAPADLIAELEVTLDPVWERLAFHIRCHWTVEQVLAGGPEIGASIAAEVHVLLPVLEQI